MEILKYLWDIADRSYANYFYLSAIKDHDRCVVVETNNKAVIAFAGSGKDVRDWVSNFRVDSIKEHRDFEKCFKKFIKFVDSVLVRNNGKEIIVTGHSRGAALATQCAEYIAKKNTPCSCVAFASPKVGNKEYRDMYNKLPINHTVVRNGWDIVTYLPPMIYRHVGKVIRLKQFWWHKFMYFRAKDHLRESYKKAVDKYYKKGQE